MKKSLLLGIFLVLIAPLSFAAEAGMKIGILDAEKILHTAPQVATINKTLENKFRPLHDKIMQEQQALQAQIDKLNRDSTTMTEKERNALQDRIIADRTRLRGEQESFQQNLNTAQDQAMGKFMETLKTAVNKIASSQNYDLVLLKQATAYSTAKTDITDQVLANLK